MAVQCRVVGGDHTGKMRGCQLLQGGARQFAVVVARQPRHFPQWTRHEHCVDAFAQCGQHLALVLLVEVTTNARQAPLLPLPSSPPSG